MKKIFNLLVLVVVLLLPITAQAVDMISLTINESSIPFSTEMGFPYISKENRTMVPIRVISENMNYNVSWDNDTKIVEIRNKLNIISFQIGSSKALVNGSEVIMDLQNGIDANTKAIIYNNRTYVPIRFITESMGGEIEYAKQGNIHKININNENLIKNKELTISAPIEIPVDAFKAYAFPEIKTAKVNFYGKALVIENYGKNTKISIEKDGVKHTYELIRDKEEIALLEGSGDYTISLYEHKEGITFYIRDRVTKNIQLNKNYNPFLISAQPVYWGDVETKLSNELVAGAITNEEKIKRIYEYVIKNIKYDFDILPTMLSQNYSYYPENERTLISKKGICYDYSALFAGLLRSQNIAVKIVKGYRVGDDTYHAWNQVWIDGEWKSVDTTWDSVIPNSNVYTQNNFFKISAID